MRTSAWKCYLAVGLALAVAHFAVSSVPLQGAMYLVLALSGAGAAIVGLRRHRPAYVLPWYLFAAGLGVFLVGDVFFYFYKLVRHVDRPFPSLADAFYLASYPLLACGLLLLLRRRSPGNDRIGLVDASIISTAMGLLAWVYLMAPSLVASMPLLDRLISLGYPLMDVVLLAVAARLVLAVGSRRPAFYLMGAAVVCLLAADVAYAVIQLTGSFDVGTPFDAGWMGFYLFWGAAALHPSMRTLTDPAPAAEPKLGRLRLAVLGGVVLLAPGALAVEAVNRSYGNVLVIAAGSMVLFLLVTIRMAGLMGAMTATASRERVLRRAAAALVATTDRESVYRATVEAAGELAAIENVMARLVYGPADQPCVVAGSGGHSGESLIGRPVPAHLLRHDASRPYGEQLNRVEEYALGEALALGPDAPVVLVAPVCVHGDTRGGIVIASDRPFPRGVVDGLDTLASQVALALESAAVTEDLHLRQSEARFRSLVQNSSDVITVVDADSAIRYQTPSVEHVLGYLPAGLVGGKLLDLIHPEDKTAMAQFLEDGARTRGVSLPIEVRMRHASGEWLDVETMSNNMLGDTNVRGVVLTSRDISERKNLERQLTHQALHDPLTNLANRALFLDRIEHAIDRQERDEALLAVLFIDLDDFKTVNDGMGHMVGDQVLAAVAERLSSCLRSGDTASRLGGDEFGILLEALDSPGKAYEIGARLLEALKGPFVIEDRLVAIDASLGIVVSTGGDDATELLRNADVAMYKAKGQGKGRFEVFEAGMHAAVLERLALKADLGRALDGGEFVSHYQPIVDLESSRIVGVEALVRWDHPTRGLLPPSAFIALAEETGLIVPIGLDVLRNACSEVRQWDETQLGRPPLRVSVNLSARQLQDPGLVADVGRAMQEAAIDPGRVTLEITESILMSDTEASVATLRKLKALGVALALDDFGTGYSSLSYLQRFPVDVLKLDKSFVDQLGVGSGEDCRLARAIIGLGRMLHMEITAEGIERPEQLARLRELGCKLGQGYHFSKPLPAREMESLLQAADVVAEALNRVAGGDRGAVS